MVLAKLIQAAELEATDRVLDVGCATGYTAAVLAHIAGQVVALEQDAGLAKAARDALVGAAAMSTWSAARSPPAGRKARLMTWSCSKAPPRSRRKRSASQLKDGGRLVCVLGSGPGSKAMLYRRSDGEVGGRPIFDASAALLPGFAKAPAFAF